MELKKFDVAEHLVDEETITEFLKAVMEEGDSSGLVAALGQVARARGMSSISERSGMSRESLYRALTKDAHPRYETVVKVLEALDLRLTLKRGRPRRPQRRAAAPV
jgi:probable addiction module antidote protein